MTVAAPSAAPVTTASTGPAGSGPDLGVLGALRWAWRRLTSIRTALILLLMLALTAWLWFGSPKHGRPYLITGSAIAAQMILFETLFALIYGFAWEGRLPRLAEAGAFALVVAGVVSCIAAHRRPAPELRAAA